MHCAINKGALLEVELPHDPDRVVFHTPSEAWQHHKSHVMGAKEDSERLSYGWVDALSYCIIRQLRHLLYSSETLLMVLAWLLLQYASMACL